MVVCFVVVEIMVDVVVWDDADGFLGMVSQLSFWRS